MGKGNRSRQDRALDTVEQVQEVTPKKTKVITTVTTIVVAAILIGCIVLSAVVNTGIVLRTKNVAKSDSYSVSGTVMSYMIYSQAQEMASLYQQYGMNYSVADIMNMQYDDGTYFDYFAESALAQVKQMLVLCEYANDNGITLSDEDKEAIDEYMASIDEVASSNLYSTNAYLKLIYGNGVNEKDVRTALELTYLSNAAYDKLKDTLEAQVTDELVNKYVEDHISDFYMADYLSYAFVAELDPEGAEATADETAAYEAKKEEMAALAANLAACESAEAFKATVVNHIANVVCAELFEELYAKEALTEAPAADVLAADKAAMLTEVAEYLKSLDSEETEEATEETEKTEDKSAYQSALDEIREELMTEAEETYLAVTTEGYYHYNTEAEEDAISELDLWLFDPEAKAGNTKVITSEGDKKSTYTVYFLTAESHLDKSETKDAAHILVSFDDYKSATAITDAEKAEAKAEAQRILDEYLAGEKTQDAFEKLGEKNTADSGVVYEGITKGQMVEEFENWVFDEARQNGDTGIVETTYGYHVMYYIGDGKLAWENKAFNGVLSDIFEAWIETEAKECNYSEKTSVIDSIR